MKVARLWLLVLVSVLGSLVVLPARAGVLVYDVIGTISDPGSSSPAPGSVSLGAGDYVAAVTPFGTLSFDYLSINVAKKTGSDPWVSLGDASSPAAPPSGTSLSFHLASTSQILPLLHAFPSEVVPGFRAGDYQITITQVPEPTTWLMLTGGLGLLGWLRLRKSENMG